MDDRVLSLQAEGFEGGDLAARLARAERSLLAHDFLLRALLTHLAVTSPQAYGALIGGFVKSKLYGSSGSAGELTREMADDLVRLLEDIAADLRR